MNCGDFVVVKKNNFKKWFVLIRVNRLKAEMRNFTSPVMKRSSKEHNIKCLHRVPEKQQLFQV